MPTDNKKYLDQEGVKYLWSKISMEDYPNNETLIAVLNAIDETKADKDKIPTKVSQLENDSKYITEEQVQADWMQIDTTAKDYIKNKPGTITNAEIDALFDGIQQVMRLDIGAVDNTILR